MVLLSLVDGVAAQSTPGACGLICHLNAYSTVAVAIATVVLATVAIIGLMRERRRAVDRMGATDARVGALADIVKEEILNAMDAPAPTTNKELTSRGLEIATALERTRNRFPEMLALATTASHDTNRAIRRAYFERTRAETLAQAVVMLGQADDPFDKNLRVWRKLEQVLDVLVDALDPFFDRETIAQDDRSPSS